MTLMDVRLVAHCGLKSDIVGGPKCHKGRHRQRHRNEINHGLIRTRENCYFASTRSSEKRPAPVTKIVNAPPMIEIFFRKLLYWPICCGPAGYSQYRCAIAVATTTNTNIRIAA